MIEAVTSRAFRRADTGECVRSGMRISGAETYIRDLVRNGLAREIKAIRAAPEQAAGRPTQPSGITLSASPAGQASPQTTASASTSGGRRRRRAADASSSSTPATSLPLGQTSCLPSIESGGSSTETSNSPESA